MYEEWKDIFGYEGSYRVSNLGNVFSLKTNKVLKPRKHSVTKTYFHTSVSLHEKGKSKQLGISRLVAGAFLKNPENKPCVNHIDNNPENNHISNLEWATHKENTQHAVKQGRLKNGALSRATPGDVLVTIKNLYEEGFKTREIGQLYGFTKWNVYHLLRKAYKLGL